MKEGMKEFLQSRGGPQTQLSTKFITEPMQSTKSSSGNGRKTTVLQVTAKPFVPFITQKPVILWGLTTQKVMQPTTKKFQFNVVPFNTLRPVIGWIVTTPKKAVTTQLLKPPTTVRLITTHSSTTTTMRWTVKDKLFNPSSSSNVYTSKISTISVAITNSAAFTVADLELPSRCMLPVVVGTCRASFTRYAYSMDQRECREFTYGGCDENENNFQSLNDCQDACTPKKINRVPEESPGGALKENKNSEDKPVTLVTGTYKFVLKELNWTDAREECKKENGWDLVAIETEKEHTQLCNYTTNQIKSYTKFWIGAEKFEDEWLWVAPFPTKIEFSKYKREINPAYRSREGNRLQLDTVSKTWIDRRFEAKIPFICEVI